MDQKIILIVASESSTEKEQEYNDWYVNKHIPMMFECEHMRKATRCKLTDENPDSAKYMTIYEFDSREDYEAFWNSPELENAKKDFDETSEKVDFLPKGGGAYEILKSWER